MQYRLSIKHRSANCRIHRTVDLPIDLPKRDDVLDLSELIKAGLPKVTVHATYSGGVTEIEAYLPSGMTVKHARKVFENGWEIYGS